MGNPFSLGLYILDGHEPVPVSDVLAWGRWYEKADRIVGRDDIGPIRVSTVFLGLNHGWGAAPPILFETMIFGAPEDFDYVGKVREYRPGMEQWRYATWDEAEQGHKVACDIARQYLAEADALLAPRVHVKEEKEC